MSARFFTVSTASTKKEKRSKKERKAAAATDSWIYFKPPLYTYKGGAKRRVRVNRVFRCRKCPISSGTPLGCLLCLDPYPGYRARLPSLAQPPATIWQALGLHQTPTRNVQPLGLRLCRNA